MQRLMRASFMFLSLAIIAALSPSPAARAATIDHVQNGTFDDGASGWTSAYGTSIHSVSLDGDSRALIASGEPAARAQQWLSGALGPGTYSVSMIARADAPVAVILVVESISDPSLRAAFSERVEAPWKSIGGTFTLGAATDARVVIEGASPGGVALYVDDVRLEGPPAVALTATPTTTPTVLAATPTVNASETPPAPTVQATSTAAATATPRVDAIADALRNGGFEDVTSDGAPFAWEKYGGTLTLSASARSGAHAARIESATDSTKWLHQAVLVDGGAWYAFSAWILAEDPAVAAAFLRISWYASDDASGSALSTSDSSERLDAPAPEWRALSTGSVLAPPDARSARVRVMLAPRDAARASILIDDATFGAAAPLAPGAAAPTPAAGGPAIADGDNALTAPRRVSDTRERPAQERAPLTHTAGAGTARLVINEVLYDAAGDGADAAGEWVELYNPGDAAVDVSGWSLSDAATHDVLDALVVPARGFAIVAASDSILSALGESGLPIVALSGRIGNGLGNDGDVLYLIDKKGAVVDAVSWGDVSAALDPPVPDVPEGHSIERVTAGADSNSARDWTDNASPSPGRAYERTAPGAPPLPSGRRIEVERAGDAFGWVPWAAVAMSTVALAATVAWRTIDELRARRPQP